MDLTIKRIKFQESGIFGEMVDILGNHVCYTLEHAYVQYNGQFAPKIPAGTYICKRGMHQLHSMKTPFETFQVMDVPNHANILIHMGNYNKDSDGCILVGKTTSDTMIGSSVETFKKFLQLQSDLDCFQLIIS